VIADDSVLMREGITRILAEGDIDVAAGVGDAPSLIAAVENCKPDLAIIDVRMPPAYIDEGLRAAIEIRRRWPEVALVVLSQFVEERYASELLADNTDKIGYLLKDRISDVGQFIESLQRVADGGTVLDPQVVRQLLTRSRKTDPLGRLTPRETEVLALMAEGRSNTAIADALVISARAVEKHIASIFLKLDLPPDTGQYHRRVMAVVRYLNSLRSVRPYSGT
jgi:DNA-binding NarL/FixJ family response regulator